MTITIQQANQRGTYKNHWLDTKYSFSFADYHNPERMGFGTLRVLNHDLIAPGQGFGAHPHANMEIITLIIKGTLAHEDNLGSGGIIKEGDLQVMSAGKGIIHAEYNDSEKEPVELLQLWIETKEKGITPRYEQQHMKWNENYPRILVSGKKQEGQLYINQEATVIAGKLRKQEQYQHQLIKGKGLFIMNIKGTITANNKELQEQDTAEIQNEETITITAKEESYLLLIEVNLKDS